MISSKSHILYAQRLLHGTYIALLLLAGVDKFFHYLVNWNIYLHPSIPHMFGMSEALFLKIMGILEIAGAVFLFFFPRLGGYVVSAFLLVVVVELIILGYYDIAVRDVVLAVGALALALLSSDPITKKHVQDHKK